MTCCVDIEEGSLALVCEGPESSFDVVDDRIDLLEILVFYE